MDTRFVKEIHVLMRNLEKYTDSQAHFAHVDASDLRNVQVDLSPKRGPYCGGKFRFGIHIPHSYPYAHPEVVCLSEIYHPNIETEVTDEHNICLNLFDEWTPSFGLIDVIHGLLYLLENPNLSDYISTLFVGSESDESFVEDVKRSMRGERFANGLQLIANESFVEYEQSLKDSQSANKTLQDAKATEENVSIEASAQDHEDADRIDSQASASLHSSGSITTSADSGLLHDRSVASSETRSSKLAETSSEFNQNGPDSGLKRRHSLNGYDFNRSSAEQTSDISIDAVDIESLIVKTNENETQESDSTFALLSETTKGANSRSLLTDNEPHTVDTQSENETRPSFKESSVTQTDDAELSESEIEAMLDARVANGFSFDECAPQFTVSETQRERFERSRQFGSEQTLVDDNALLEFLNEFDTDSDDTQSQADTYTDSDSETWHVPSSHSSTSSMSPPSGPVQRAVRLFYRVCYAFADEENRESSLHGHLFAQEFGILCSFVCFFGRTAAGCLQMASRAAEAHGPATSRRNRLHVKSESQCSDSFSSEEITTAVATTTAAHRANPTLAQIDNEPRLVSIRHLHDTVMHNPLNDSHTLRDSNDKL